MYGTGWARIAARSLREDLALRPTLFDRLEKHGSQDIKAKTSLDAKITTGSTLTVLYRIALLARHAIHYQ